MKKKSSKPAQSTLVVMADFGNGPYAWLRRPGEPPEVCGSNIADAVSGFPEKYKISQELQKDFAEWAALFEHGCGKSGFDWSAFNEQGLGLARRLKREVGERYDVEYHVAMEDPDHPRKKNIIPVGETNKTY